MCGKHGVVELLLLGVMKRSGKGIIHGLLCRSFPFLDGQGIIEHSLLCPLEARGEGYLLNVAKREREIGLRYRMKISGELSVEFLIIQPELSTNLLKLSTDGK